MKILIVIMMFFILCSLIIISNNNLALSDDGELEKFSEFYLNWTDSVYSNAQFLTGEVVRLEWFPE